MVMIQRELRLILTQAQAPQTQEEISALEMMIDPIGDKIEKIGEIDGFPATILDAELIGRTEIEFVKLDYLSEGRLYYQTFPLAIFYSL